MENVKIVTGGPAEVEKKVAAYLNGHEKAKILQSSVAVAFEPAPPPKDDKAKAQPPKAVTTVCVILGTDT